MKNALMFAVTILTLVVLPFPTPAYAEEEEEDCSKLLTEEAQTQCEADQAKPPKPPIVTGVGGHGGRGGSGGQGGGGPTKGLNLSGELVIGLLVTTFLLSVLVSFLLMKKVQGNNDEVAKLLATEHKKLKDALLRKGTIVPTDLV